MFRSKLTALAVAFSCVLGFASQSRAEVKQDELAKLKGNWNLVTEDNGHAVNPGNGKSLLIEGDKITPLRDGKSDQERAGRNGDSWQWTIVLLEPAGDHVNIDFKMTIDKKEETCHGIYRLKGDTMELCFDVEGGARPTEFKAGKNTGVFVLKQGPAAAAPTTRKA